MKFEDYESLCNQQRKVQELGMYCVKFGLTKADLEVVLHKKRIEQSYEDARYRGTRK